MNSWFRYSVLFLFSFLSSGLVANEVRNGDFSDATRFWFVLVNGGFRDSEKIQSYVRTSGNGLQMIVDEIPEEKEQPASVLLNQRVQTLKTGTEYVLRFEVLGQVNESMLVGLGKAVTYGPDRGNHSGGIPVQEIKMTEEWQKIEIPFIYNADKTLSLPDDARETLLQFRVGKITNLYLRSVSITEK